MNERIKELAIEAEFSEKDLHIQGDNFQKFAELLIKDCASICEINGQSYKYSFTPARARLAESTSNHCGLMIKKHFGEIGRAHV